MKVTTVVSLIVLLATGCSDRSSHNTSAPVAQLLPPAAADAPTWKIGEDIGGKTVMIDGKREAIPDDVAATKRKMDAAARETLDEMDAMQKKRLERFNDTDMKP